MQDIEDDEPGPLAACAPGGDPMAAFAAQRDQAYGVGLVEWACSRCQEPQLWAGARFCMSCGQARSGPPPASCPLAGEGSPVQETPVATQPAPAGPARASPIRLRQVAKRATWTEYAALRRNKS